MELDMKDITQANYLASKDNNDAEKNSKRELIKSDYGDLFEHLNIDIMNTTYSLDRVQTKEFKPILTQLVEKKKNLEHNRTEFNKRLAKSAGDVA